MAEKQVAEKEEVTVEDLENIEFQPGIVRGDPDEVGVLVTEVRRAREVKTKIDIPVGYEKDIKIGSKTGTLVLYLNVPAEIDDGLYYPVAEWRCTQERLDDCDNWPQWKSFVVFENGQQLRDLNGRVINAQFFVYRAIQGMIEDDDGKFFFAPPYMSQFVKQSSLGFPVIKGSDIPDAINQMRGLVIGASRRRGE